MLEGILHFLNKFLKAYCVVSFMICYFTVVCFTINLMIELTLDTFSTERNSGLQNLYIACTFFLLLSFAFNAFYILSLYWDVVDAVRKKDGGKYTVIRLMLFLVDLIGGGIWFGMSHSAGLNLFLKDVLLVSYIKAGVLTVLCSLYLAFGVYTECNIEIFPKKKSCRVCFGMVICFLITLTITAPIVYSFSEAGSKAITFSAVCPLFSLLLLVWLLFRGSREEKSGFVFKTGVFLFMTLVYAVLCILSSIAHYQCGPQCQIALPVKNTASRQTRDIQDTVQIPGYSICGKTWSKLKLSITDMAFLANLGYKIDNKVHNTTISALVNDYFLPRGMKWDVESINSKKPSFYHIRNNDQMVHIIGIRGTSDNRDWLENLKIWNEIAIFQLFFGIFSVKNLPEKFVSTYVLVASILDHHDSYVDKMEEYIKQETQKNRTDQEREEYFLVGHSLGGGLAKIVGTKLKIPSIAFSSPGEMYNHLKYGYTLEDLEKYTTSFGARNDIISWIDKPGGLVQGVNCDNCGFFDIHSIRNTYENLKKKCP